MEFEISPPTITGFVTDVAIKLSRKTFKSKYFISILPNFYIWWNGGEK